ncbi:sensor histidine kinase [Candidatus Nitrosotenuis aquarius]|uniref:sensor histidine kinase n=1 Tax=Candidatus Nitrosotenuis aquarius TaxID=1846278 RepID=UPI000C1DD989|nr:sensor histidine kinase [Candidatus Nitrosotenuis aquarius]
MNKPDSLKYSVSGRLTKLLGRESVSTDEAALFELVKNSYDADATKVIVKFENIDSFQKEYKKLEKIYSEILSALRASKTSLSLDEIERLIQNDPKYLEQEHIVNELMKKTKILITDNGNGMTIDQIQNKWMKIGVSKEQHEILTSKGRRVVGEKGVGRFAVEKLSNKVTLRSRPRNYNQTIMFTCDWSEFERAKNLTDVKIPITYMKKDPSDHGLTILLEDLREAWTEKKIKNFLNQLSMLILPKSHASSNFEVKVVYQMNGKELNIEVESSLFKIAPYKFESILSEDSMIRFTSFWYKDEQIIPNKRKKEYNELLDVFPFVRYDVDGTRLGEAAIAKCGPVKLTFYGYPFDPSGRDLGWSDWYGKTRVEQIQQDVEYASGIKIYRDGFRVRPYGDLNNDWLGTGSSARAAAGKLPPKNIIGWVEISRDKNSNVLDTTTREKIIENEAFNDLKDFVTESMRRYYVFSEKRRQEIIKKETRKKTPSLVVKLTKFVEEDSSMTKSTKEKLLGSLNEIQEKLVGEERTEYATKTSLMDELGAYRNLASLGITTGAVSHEVKDYLKKILLHTGVLKRTIDGTTIDQEKLKQSLDIIAPSVENLSSFMTLVSGFTSDLSSRKKEFRMKKEINLHNEIEEIKQSLSGIFSRWNIELENKVPSQLPKLYMYKADIQSILLNLISNSIKSLKILVSERRELGKKGIIRISTYTTKTDITMFVSDNGIGIPTIDRGLVFDLFWTRAASHQSVKSGSGLGLPIIKEIIRDYKGDISIEKSELATGATFKIVFPKSEILR